MKRTHRLGLPPVLFALTLAWGTSAHSQVLWSHESPPQPTFISEAVLNGREASPLSDSELSKIRAAIHEQVAAHSDRRPCAPQIILDGDPSADIGWRTLKEKVKQGRLILRGEVVSIQAGWQFIFPRTIALVKLRVQEILAGTSAPALGSLVTYLQRFGTMEVDGYKVCTLPEPLDFVAAIGKEVIVTAARIEPGSEDLLYLNPKTDLYPIDGNSVRVLRRASEEAEEVLLDDLRVLAQGRREQK